MEGEDSARSAMDYALRVLSRRRISSGALYAMMSRKGFSGPACDSCVERLREWGYLNDAEYARDTLKAVSASCPVGRRRAEHELRKRLVDPVLTQAVLDETYQGLSEEALAREAALRYLGGRDIRSLRLEERVRLARWLERRGFGPESIRSALYALGTQDPDEAGRKPY